MYDILLGGESIGTAQVQRQGLYYIFDCRCDLSGEVVYRITVRCGENTQSLGIPVPDGNRFRLRTKIPVKNLGEGELSFRMVPKHANTDEKFVPISPEEPFRYLKRLQNAFLQVRDGKVGVVIRN
jgi:hypothetical protein